MTKTIDGRRHKWKQFFPILFLAAGMVALTVIVLLKGMDKPPIELLYIHDGVCDVKIDPYYEEKEDTFYIYLPSYASRRNTKLSLKAPGLTWIRDEQGNSYGNKIAQVPQGEPLTMTIRSLLYKQTVKIKVFHTKGAASLFVEGEEGFLDEIHMNKRNREDVTVYMASDDGKQLFQRRATMSGRGNGSWYDQDKRPYNLNFDNRISIEGVFRDIEKICLLAEYSDESKMRNALAYYAGKEVGIPYASEYMYTNLYIDGEYKGLYGIVTKQEYKKHIDSDGIKAVFERTNNREDADFILPDFGEKAFNILHGDPEYVQEMVRRLDRAMSQRDWEDCFQRIDLESFALKYALDEFLGNMDLAHASQYYYINQEDVIHCMLPWDYDWTIGSAILAYDSKPIWVMRAYMSRENWSTVMIESEDFREAVVHALETYFADDFLNKLTEHVQKLSIQVAPSRTADKERWKYARSYDGIDVSSGLKTTNEFYQMFCAYFPQRRDFMLDYFGDIEKYCYVQFDGGWFGGFCIPKGARLAPYLENATAYEKGGASPGMIGWFSENGKQPHEIDTVTENMNFTRRFT